MARSSLLQSPSQVRLPRQNSHASLCWASWALTCVRRAGPNLTALTTCTRIRAWLERLHAENGCPPTGKWRKASLHWPSRRHICMEFCCVPSWPCGQHWECNSNKAILIIKPSIIINVRCETPTATSRFRFRSQICKDHQRFTSEHSP